MNEQGINREELRFPSADGRSTIRALVWWPALAAGARPRGVVQVIHGMAEHVERYGALACLFAAHGFVVCGDDHAGHGASCDPDSYGCLPARGGAEALVADEHTLRRLMTERVGAYVPYLLLGHSLGSYIARVYLAERGEGLAGVVLSGTGTLPVAVSWAGHARARRTRAAGLGRGSVRVAGPLPVALVWAGHALARLTCAARGEDYRSKLLDGMGVGGYARAVPGPTGCEWLSHNEKNVATYVADSRCGFMFSAGGYAAVTKLTARACSLAWARRAPHDVPLLFVSGAEDPVGDNGRGVRAAAELARRAGQRHVDVRIYEGMRHEIFNEDDGGRVMADVLSWVEERLGTDEKGR